MGCGNWVVAAIGEKSWWESGIKCLKGVREVRVDVCGVYRILIAIAMKSKSRENWREVWTVDWVDR